MADKTFRVTMNVDLGAESILCQELENMLRSRARQIAREEFDKVLREETARIVKGRIDSIGRSSWFGQIDTLIVRALRDDLSDKLKLDDTLISKHVPSVLSSFLLNRVKGTGEVGVDQYVRKISEEAVRNFLIGRAKEATANDE